ncbi:MAG TPA: TIGR00341 family protein [Methanobacterium sp.]|nr:TIGR00341 family protein [Methanobacterium sp.]HOI40767.1 TIGR00341 family protein [Methanobacterium sp.]
MTLRLIEMSLPKGFKEKVVDLLNEYNVIEIMDFEISNGLTLYKILVTTEDSESVLDQLEKSYSHLEGFRIFIMPVQASIPRIEENNNGISISEDKGKNSEKSERISREELYTNVRSISKPTRVYFVMVILSSLVASIGVLNNNVAVIIGAMVIAPLLGPNMGLSLATVLRDYDLALSALKSIILGVGTAIVISFIVGSLVSFDPSIPAIALRTDVAIAGIFLAFASGMAGSIAFTTDVSSALIGVMVAVALLPPLAVFGLLLGAGYYYLAIGAFLLFLVNLVCINLSGVLTFYVQRIKPLHTWEALSAYKITYLAIGIWIFLLIVLLALIQIRKII